mgnify:CR=1 FL=1
MKNLTFLFLSLFLVFACEKEHNPTIPENEFIEVPIILHGMDISYAPLMRSGLDIIEYGLQVFTIQEQQETPYAWAVFMEGKLPSTKIKLKKGTTYKFCTTIVNHDNKINTVTNLTTLKETIYDHKYYFMYPYNIVDSTSSGFSTEYFYYTEKQMLNYTDPDKGSDFFYCADIYYGECIYVAKNEEPIVINTERKSAGLVVQAEYNGESLPSTNEVILNNERKAVMKTGDLILITPKHLDKINNSAFDITLSMAYEENNKQIILKLKPNEKATVRMNFGGEDRFLSFQINLPESTLKESEY